jgi:hypothetical protein
LSGESTLRCASITVFSLTLQVLLEANESVRSQRFHETVLAIYEIVEKKLYKLRCQKIEDYFKETFKISRAQGASFPPI